MVFLMSKIHGTTQNKILSKICSRLKTENIAYTSRHNNHKCLATLINIKHSHRVQ